MDSITQPLETESFSYRWLATEASSSNSALLNNDESSPNFDFETSTMVEASLVHADKLFSNGVIKPQYNYESSTSNTISSSLPSSLFSVHSHAEEFQGIFPRKWSTLPRKIVSKYLRCFVPVKGTRGRIRVDDVNRRTLEVKSNSSPETSSPRVRRQSSIWVDSDESSIHEAILYCKQSNGLST